VPGACAFRHPRAPSPDRRKRMTSTLDFNTILAYRSTTTQLTGRHMMADSSSLSTEAQPGESPAQTKARLRRERLAAKSGASRLQQITALQGGPPKSLSEIEKDLPGKWSA
jgi:hypothetical protein